MLKDGYEGTYTGTPTNTDEIGQEQEEQDSVEKALTDLEESQILLDEALMGFVETQNRCIVSLSVVCLVSVILNIVLFTVIIKG